MARGRKPQSTAVQERNGALKKNPQRRNENEPPVKRGMPNVPATVKSDKFAHAQWKVVCQLLDEMGILSTSDVFLIELFCITYSEMVAMLKDRKKRGTVIDGKRNANSTDYHKHQDRLVKLMAEMGLTPSARTRLSAQSIKPDTVDPFTEFTQRILERRDSAN